MNLSDEKYNQFALVREMMDVCDLVRNFDLAQAEKAAEKLGQTRRLFLTGEGSSRIFPAKNSRLKALKWGLDINIETDGGRQASLYDLSDFAVFLVSNSGRTKEVVELAKKLVQAGHNKCFGLCAWSDNILEEVLGKDKTYMLSCGKEDAVAATKSVIEQALFFEAVISKISERQNAQALSKLPDQLAQALTMQIDSEIVATAAKAGTIYFAGYNDGVAEELRLKTNEITRKKSDFLEGTYAVHGIEEVMRPKDVVFVIDPIEEEAAKFKEVLVDGVGVKVVAISDKQTPFDTILIPSAGEFDQYVQLCAGWNLLVEIGMHLNINLDKPQRARKIGNAF